MRQGFYERNRVPIIRGNGRFVDAHTLMVEEASGAHHHLTADAFCIAAGARPYRPPDVDFNHPRVFDSDTILNLSYTPQSIIIYGAVTFPFANVLERPLISTTLMQRAPVHGGRSASRQSRPRGRRRSPGRRRSGSSPTGSAAGSSSTG